MDMRELKALELAARAKIVHGDDGAWLVPSQSTGGVYRVLTWPGAEKCECEDWQLRQDTCKHILAARLVEERDGKRLAPSIECDAVPKKKTYGQNWSAYNESQTTEKRRLRVLLAELCAGIAEPVWRGTGRKPVSIADRLFSVIYKVYCGQSTRRYMTDLEEARDAGHLSRIACFSKICKFFRDPDLTDALKDLVARSAMPLRAVETEFAVDSSGFSVSKFVRWHDEKYGVERSGRDWVKVHVCTGVKTGVVTAVEIKDRDANDCPILPHLIAATKKRGFTIKELSADKGYLSAENVEVISAAGAMPFIAPKTNTTGGVGGLFEKMYHYYSFNREDFLRHYHKRSNVESCFSAVKRKFGDHVRSRDAVSMVNEAMAKFVCLNLCAVILSQIELGIEATFWPAEKEERRDVLSLSRRG